MKTYLMKMRSNTYHLYDATNGKVIAFINRSADKYWICNTPDNIGISHLSPYHAAIEAGYDVDMFKTISALNGRY